MSRSTLSITDWCSGFSSPYSSRHAAKIFPELARWKTTNCKTNLFSCINPFIAQKCLITRVEPRLWSHFWHNQFWKMEKWETKRRRNECVTNEPQRTSAERLVNSCRIFRTMPEYVWFTPIVQLCLENLNEDLATLPTFPSLWNIVKALSLFVLSYVATKLRSSREEWEVRAIKLHFLAPEWKLV